MNLLRVLESLHKIVHTQQSIIFSSDIDSNTPNRTFGSVVESTIYKDLGHVVEETLHILVDVLIEFLLDCAEIHWVLDDREVVGNALG